MWWKIGDFSNNRCKRIKVAFAGQDKMTICPRCGRGDKMTKKLTRIPKYYLNEDDEMTTKKAEEYLDQEFPKGETKFRGQAMVLLALAKHEGKLQAINEFKEKLKERLSIIDFWQEENIWIAINKKIEETVQEMKA